ncbi:MAG: protein translocase subunit SecF [Oscillospiraceae bacterium]|nr:protein translocase subunit SecF [Oscillospiraceae bacterium]
MKIPKIRFIGNLTKCLILSGAIALVVTAGLFINGIGLDIEFRGGAIITYSYEGNLSIDEFKGRLDEIAGIPMAVQATENIATGQSNYVASLPGDRSLNSDEMLRINTEIAAVFPANSVQAAEIKNVDPSIGHSFLMKCILAVALASVLMIIYVALRFRTIGGWSAGVMAVLALIHNVFIVFGVFVLFRIPLNMNFIAVLLTILGYSINDTIVIYDRIRENNKIKGASMQLPELVDYSINQSFKRTVMTTVSTVLAMTVVMVVAILFNVSTITSFAFPLTVGLIAGAYSSICLAAPLWVRWETRKKGTA